MNDRHKMTKPITGLASRLRDRLSRYLMHMFRGTEKLNKDQILASQSPQGKAHSPLRLWRWSFTSQLASAVNADEV